MRDLLCGVCAGVLLVGAFCADVHAGEPAPPYVVLQTRPPESGKHCAGGGNQAQMIPSPAQPYAYGWFGAQPRTQWGRSFGYYRNYTQWRQW